MAESMSRMENAIIAGLLGALGPAQDSQ